MDFHRGRTTKPNARAPKSITLERLNKFLEDEGGHYKNQSIRNQIYSTSFPVKSIRAYSHPKTHERPSPNWILGIEPQVSSSALNGTSLPPPPPSQQWPEVKLGDSFGPSWSTHWFRVEIALPSSSSHPIHFRWDSGSEALLLNEKGEPLQGLTGGDGGDRRHVYPLKPHQLQQEGGVLVLLVEMAGNGLFGAGRDGSLILPPNPDRTYTLKRCDIALFEQEAYDLWMDFTIITEMAKELDVETSPRAGQALGVANRIMDICALDSISSPIAWRDSLKLSKRFLEDSGSPSLQHTIFACGHCHIDLCWLWPFSETIRKGARSFASQLELMDHYPNYRFAQSQAQLFQWMKDKYPELWTRIKEKVKTGQFVPVGGSWVEMDGILTGGESMVRQLLYGQEFFEEEFESRTNIFWLPDSFGYSAQLPQILKKCGIERFVTQKLSWNLINKFPFSTFFWKALDGSEIISHFPPADTYGAKLEVSELLYSVKNFKEKDTNQMQSLCLFGWGDGGGGPTIEHLERLKRFQETDGIPRIVNATPSQFFEKCEKDAKEWGLHVWDGELYLEGHRGTYTSQGSIKKSNRVSELLLRDLEFFATVASFSSFPFSSSSSSFSSSGGFLYPKEEIERLWKLVLLNQFHDCLPGSAIRLAYDEAHEFYRQVFEGAQKIKSEAFRAIGLTTDHQVEGEGDLNLSGNWVVFNTLSLDSREVLEVPNSHSSLFEGESISVQRNENGKKLIVTPTVPAFGWSEINLASISSLSTSTGVGEVKVERLENNKGYIMENSFIQVHLHSETATLDVWDKRTNRFVIRKGNQFLLFSDTPLFWDAWDVEVYDQNTRRLPSLDGGVDIQIIEEGPLRASLQVKQTLTKRKSRVVQTMQLTALSSRLDFLTEIDWIDESHVFLKVSFPTTIRSTEATFEVQFGHLRRPTHRNTSWDVARFEVPAQKWADLSEFGGGIAVLNDCKYGYSIEGGEILLSLLKAPKAPDETCDIEDRSHHVFTYSLLPHLGSLQEGDVIGEANRLNSPLISAFLASNSPSPSLSDSFGASSSSSSFISILGTKNKNVVIEAVKRAQKKENAVVLRLYEAFGGRTQEIVRLKLNLGRRKIVAAERTNLLEDKEEELRVSPTDGTIEVGFLCAFEIVTILAVLE